MEGVIVHTIFLVVGEKFFVGSDSGHHTLSFGIVRAAEALYQLEDADHVLSTADCCKLVRCFEVVLEGGGALVIDNALPRVEVIR